MKTIIMVMATLVTVLTGCESTRSNDADDHRSKFYFTLNSEVKEPSGAQSHSSDPNPASSSRNVGQSGTATDTNAAPANP